MDPGPAMQPKRRGAPQHWSRFPDRDLTSHRGPDVDREFRASDSPRTVDGESDTEMEQPEDADD